MTASSPPFLISEVACDSPLHLQQLDLRGRVLRIPLGLDPASARNPREAEARHWVAIDPSSGAVVGCVSLLPLAHPGDSKLFQMAVEPHLQGSGVGRALVHTLEAAARSAGARRILLHARITAEGFYARLGYLAEGDIFDEVSIPHRRMVKAL